MTTFELQPEPLGPVWDNRGREWSPLREIGNTQWVLSRELYPTMVEWPELVYEHGPISDTPPAPKAGYIVPWDQVTHLPNGTIVVDEYNDLAEAVIVYQGVAFGSKKYDSAHKLPRATYRIVEVGK